MASGSRYMVSSSGRRPAIGVSKVPLDFSGQTESLASSRGLTRVPIPVMARSSPVSAPVASPSLTVEVGGRGSRGRLPPVCRGLDAASGATALPPGSFSASVASITFATKIAGEESRETPSAACRAGLASESERITTASTASTAVRMAACGAPGQKVAGQRRRASRDRQDAGPALPTAMRPSMAGTAAICLRASAPVTTSAEASREVPAKACRASQIGPVSREAPSVRPCASVASTFFSRTAKSTREAARPGLTGMAFSPSMALSGRPTAQNGRIGRQGRPSTKAPATLSGSACRGRAAAKGSPACRIETASCQARGYAYAVIAGATAGTAAVKMAISEVRESGRGLLSPIRLSCPGMPVTVEAETAFEDATPGLTALDAAVLLGAEVIAATAYSGRGIIYVQSIEEA